MERKKAEKKKDKKTAHIYVKTRAVESESRKVGKSLKIGFDFLLDFLARMPKCHKMPKNAIKCQNACTSGQGPASEYFF